MTIFEFLLLQNNKPEFIHYELIFYFKSASAVQVANLISGWHQFHNDCIRILPPAPGIVYILK
ncbi:hypothetical protein E0X18_00395 [Salmonella enterica subsp. enterica serovar Tudu]|uniref:Uncharacterized protein n=1 Tax=Salmonella enterica subsp. enterica serovar Tudu TaxID=2021402 RepID=A0A5H7CQV9_SALET|nr:hypothetical protein [Salmonella enterica subsp. enterica serovar Tudu]ECD4160008.1 hypothetical protein [Salmonella enterica subsp. enterica serovar Tudu]MJX10670.1 hypothetical protein [Salmonella enterica subsp. enterica serovar Tudu]